MLNSDLIKATASAIGFDMCGVVRCQKFAAEGEFLKQWIADGKVSNLSYLQRNIDKRTDATLLVEGAKSVIVCGVSYKNRYSEGYKDCNQKIASYALTTDYHITIKQMLQQLCATLKKGCPTLSGRIFTDSAPVFEKRYAVEAGLGWIGRQSLLVTPQFGTFVLLGVAIISEECDRYDSPLQGVGCGECRRCVEACPNGAIVERHIDTRRCISRATIERQSDDNTPLHGWIFGCDECQSCCPYNRRAAAATNPRFTPTFDPIAIDWNKIDEAEFSLRFANTPLSRSSLERILSNIDTTTQMDK
ncbi:MAG: tRNA epoxyqueuosine(34) reductase QueG [Alistipes sp.]|nr:tRNA epoxyqueuosine(34) reductase QueG [Alistipes sp.]